MNRPNANPDWDRLIERYFDALTTDADERRLRRFLCSPAGADPRYDDVRAVMGFMAVGRQAERRRQWARPRRRQAHWAVAACFLAVVAAGAGWVVTDSRRNVCVAYVDGRRITNTESVMRQVARSIDAVGRPDAASTVEQQLNDMFNTLDAETPRPARP